MATAPSSKLPPQLKGEIINLIEERLKELYVTRSDFRALQRVMKELAEAQKRTEQRVEELAEAQKRTEQRVEELTEAQKRTEQRVEELTEAQKRTEQRVEELTEAQKRTEQRMDSLTQRMEELAEAQKRTEQRMDALTQALTQTQLELKQLVEEHKITRKLLGDLTNTVGYGLEDTIMKYIHDYALKEYGIAISTVDRRYITYPDGRYDEINIYAEGTKNGTNVYLIGESKAQLGKKDADNFNKMISRLHNQLQGEIIPFLVCYSCAPDVEQYISNTYPIIRIHKSFEFYKYKKSFD